jgi:hypothetical protein
MAAQAGMPQVPHLEKIIPSPRRLALPPLADHDSSKKIRSIAIVAALATVIVRGFMLPTRSNPGHP